MGEIGLVAVAGFASFHLAREEFADFLFLHGNGGQHNMDGLAAEHLQDAFAKVGFEHFNALFLKIGVESAFFGKHGFAFHEMLDLVTGQDVCHNLAIFFGVFGPMDNGAIARGVLFKLQQEFCEMGIAVHLQLGCHFAQVFPFGYVLGHAVSFLAYHPECFVVPFGLLGVLQEFCGLCCVLRHFLRVFERCEES